MEVVSDDPQRFLADQGRLLEMMREKSEELEKKERAAAAAGNTPTRGGRKPLEDLDLVKAGMGGSVVSDHIGPVQFNMGGIQVDADDMVQRLKVWDTARPVSFSCFLAFRPPFFGPKRRTIANGTANRTARIMAPTRPPRLPTASLLRSTTPPAWRPSS